MNSNCLEKAFSDFIDRREYDQAENALFEIVHTAFKAGWLAAGGEAPESQNVFKIIGKENADHIEE